MGNKLARGLVVLLGAVLGCVLVALIDEVFVVFSGLQLHVVVLEWVMPVAYIVGALAFGIIFYFLSPKIVAGISRSLHNAERLFSELPTADILYGVLGLIVGLLVALLLSTLIRDLNIGWLSLLINIVLYAFCGYQGANIAIKRRSELGEAGLFRSRHGGEKAGRNASARPKILDTSVIIDGRIFDICKTGILEGEIIVPMFVLQELRHIADSADGLKRNRGRRGLDILNSMQRELHQPIRIEEKDYDDIAEVDAKLLKLAEDRGGIVVTNDYNLNKVAAVQKVSVFNINDLANAIKPVLLPGEEMSVQVMREGKEAGQGVAYLDDGTMIVIEGGKRFVGEKVDIVVTSVLQTSAGRMIFAKIKFEKT